MCDPPKRGKLANFRLKKWEVGRAPSSSCPLLSRMRAGHTVRPPRRYIPFVTDSSAKRGEGESGRTLCRLCVQ